MTAQEGQTTEMTAPRGQVQRYSGSWTKSHIGTKELRHAEQKIESSTDVCYISHGRSCTRTIGQRAGGHAGGTCQSQGQAGHFTVLLLVVCRHHAGFRFRGLGVAAFNFCFFCIFGLEEEQITHFLLLKRKHQMRSMKGLCCRGTAHHI